MVIGWIKRLGAPKTACGPLCRDVQNEVANIGRADALARHLKIRGGSSAHPECLEFPSHP